MPLFNSSEIKASNAIHNLSDDEPRTTSATPSTTFSTRICFLLYNGSPTIASSFA
jgi:hypothetical protein